MTRPLRIHLLGPFEIFYNGQPLSNADWRSQQTRTVAKILLARRRQVVTSEQIIEILWPTDSPETARRRLHVRISQFRTALRAGKSLIQTVDSGYIFDPAALCWVDADEFQSLISEGSSYRETGQQLMAIRVYEQARQLYRGDFFAEDLYSDWSHAIREDYCERFFALLLELSDCYAQQGRYRLAITRAREALTRDPLCETICARLMLYHYYAGERAQALRVYERCRQMLSTELAIAPLDSTAQLEAQIRAGTLWANPEALRYPPPLYEGQLFEVPYALGEIPFMDRDREYAWLVAQWQDPTQQVILLEGEAGIGKSRLVEIFSGYITSLGARVLRARVPPIEHAPLAPLSAALQPLLTESLLRRLDPSTLAALVMIFPELRKRIDHLPDLPALPSDRERQRLYQAISALAAACDKTPTLLLIDDAHRLGAADVDVLARLSTVFKILLSYRSEETPPKHPIRTAFGSASLQLDPLSATSVHALIRQLSGHDMPTIADQISTLSGGNPLFLVVLLQHLFETGHIYVNISGDWEVSGQDPPSLPPTVRATIEARLQRLNRNQRQIFDLAAILGGEFDFDLLQAASQQPEDILLPILDELIDAALINEPRSFERREFIISHDRFTEVAYETIPGVRRKRMHRQAAKAIETVFAGQISAYYQVLADHYDKAKDTDRAASYAVLAGEQAAARFANTEALRYLGRALELTPTNNFNQRARLLLIREKVHDLQGMRQPQADDLAALETNRAKLQPYQQAEIHLRRAAYEWVLGNDDKCEAALSETILCARACAAADVEAGAYLLKGRAAKNQAQARRDLERARRLARKTKQRSMEGDIVRCLGNACFWQNSYAESQAYFTEALSIHREEGDLRGELSALNNLAQVLQLLGDPQNAVKFFEQALAICHNIGDRLAEGVLLTNLGGLTAQLGHLQQAQIWLEQALVVRDEIGNEEGAALAHKNLGDVYRQQGQYARSQAHYERALAINTRIQHSEQSGATLDALSVLYRELGDYERARDFLGQALGVLSDEDSPNRIQTLMNGSLLNHVCGDHARALALGQQALTPSMDLPALQATIMTNIGHALAGLHQFNEARQRFQRALAIYQNLGQSHRAVDTLAGLAQVCVVQEDLGQAAEHVEEILKEWEKGTPDGADRVLWVYLVCYQVLLRLKDDRALQILPAAVTLLKERADCIEEDVLRHTYLEQVPENLEFLRLWRGSTEVRSQNHSG